MIHVNQRKRCSMLQVLVFWTIWHGTFQGSPIICNMVFILLDLGLEALQSNNFIEKRFVGKFISLSLGFPILLASSDKKELGARWCKMFHINRPLSPNSRWKLRFFQNLQGEWKFRKGTCPLKPFWEQKTITFTQGHPCWNRRLGFPRFFSQIVVPPFLGTKLCLRRERPSLVQI